MGNLCVEKKEKAQRPGSTHSNKGGLPKTNFCPAQAVGDRQESIRSPPGAMYPISFSESSATHDFIRLPALYSLGIKEEQHNGSSPLLLVSYIIY